MYAKRTGIKHLALICALAVLAGLLPPPASRATAESGCATIYGPLDGWQIELCASDPNVPATMEVFLDGSVQGRAALVRVSHRSQGYGGSPQVAVIYASGYVRLKQNADPVPPIPFGSSFVLGPAYWSSAGVYRHNPRLTRIEVDTRWLHTGPLRLQVEGSNGVFDLSYQLALPGPRDRQTRLHVTQTYTATTDVTIDPARRALSEGFKLVQVSSMYVNEGAACDGGQVDCHDSNAARHIGADLARHQVAFAALAPPSFVYSQTSPLSSTWLDVLHTDDTSWQGNTPNVRIALDGLPDDHTITPQGWIAATTDPDHDNFGLWLHDDGPASDHWTAGQSETVGYWLLAQDDPPEPWADLGLRTGHTFLDFEGAYNCSFARDPHQTVAGSIETIPGYSDTAMQLNYDLGDQDRNWAQVRCDFGRALDLSATDHLRFDWRGDPATANSIEVGLIDREGDTWRIFARAYPHVTHRSWWGQLVIPFNFLHPWHGGTFDPANVVAVFVSVVKTDGADDTGGVGSLAIDNLNAFSASSIPVPPVPRSRMTNDVARAQAAHWLAAQQWSTGLLKSWPEETSDPAHTYDQALALLVFSREGMWPEADALVGALVGTQYNDGSWSKSYHSDNLHCVHCHKWEGDIAWAVYALSRYLALGGDHPQAHGTMTKAADWLTTRMGTDGCLLINHTEGTLDAWWALQAAGWDYRDEADALKACLLTEYWDDEVGRFRGGRRPDQQHPYLDNQTWGAAFLRAVGRVEDAQRALNYAYHVFRLPAQGGQLYGLDGQAGPWSVWNEGTGQYVAVGGGGANDGSAEALLAELLAQQQRDGALRGSPDDFSGGGVWTTRWHGVAPTAWLYFALTPGEPFYPTRWIWLPVILKGYSFGF